MANDPKVTATQQVQQTQQASQLAAAAVKKGADLKATFEEMLKKDFSIQLKMPNSHAQKAVTTYRTLAAIKKAQRDLITQLAQLEQFIKELLKASARAEAGAGKAAYEHWRKHAGGEVLTTEQLAQEYRHKQNELHELLERSKHLDTKRVACEEQLAAITKEYDAKYLAVMELYKADHEQLIIKLTEQETQLEATRDQQLTQLGETTAEKIETIAKETVEQQENLGKAEQVELKDLMHKELQERADLKNEFNAINERLENLKAEAKDAATPQAQIVAARKISEETDVSLKPSMMKKLTSGEAIDEKIAKLQKENVLAQKALAEKFQTQAQDIKQSYATQQAKLIEQRDAKLANVNVEDKKQRAEINQEFKSKLDSLHTEYQGKFSDLDSRKDAALQALQQEQAAKVTEIENQLKNIQDQQADIQNGIRKISAKPTPASAAEVKQEKSEEKLETEAKRSRSLFDTPTLTPREKP